MILALILAVTPPALPTCDSSGPLEVHGRDTRALVGEKQRLALWSNRRHSELRFEWRVVESPAGSRDLLAQPTGVVTRTSASCEHSYFDGTVPNFTPDLPGRYVFEVRVTELATGGVAIGHAQMDVSSTAPSAEPATGCSVVGWPLLCAGLALLRRRRHSRELIALSSV